MWVTSDGGGEKNPKAHVLNFFYVVSNVRNQILICLCNGFFILFWSDLLLCCTLLLILQAPLFLEEGEKVRECPFSGLKEKKTIQNAWESSFHYTRWSADPDVHNFIVNKENGHGGMPLLQFSGVAACSRGSRSSLLQVTPLPAWGTPRLGGETWERQHEPWRFVALLLACKNDVVLRNSTRMVL